MKNISQFTSVLLLVLTGCAANRGTSPAWSAGKSLSDGPAMHVEEVAPTPAPTLRVTNKTLTELRRAIATVYITDGWKVNVDSNERMVFVKEVNDSAAKRWYAWSPDNPVYVREEITFSENSGGITATPKQEIIANYGSIRIADPAASYTRTAERFSKVQASFQPVQPKRLAGSVDPAMFSQVDWK